MLELLPPSPNQGLIEMLKALTKEAEAGEITGMAGVVVYRGGAYGQLFSGSIHNDCFKAIGAIEILKHEFIHRNIQSENYDHSC
jgi:hypothetical protein